MERNRICIVCENEFTTKSPTKKTCSDACFSQTSDVQQHVSECWEELVIKKAWYENRRKMVECECSCSKVFTTRYDSVKNRKTKSCGHLTQYKAKDIKGQRSGKLKAIMPVGKTESGENIWLCECECGSTSLIEAGRFYKTKSCGCVHEEILNAGRKSANSKHCIEGTSVTRAKEAIEGKLLSNNSSGHRGVHWDKERQKWVARIVFKGKTHFIGRYDNFTEACNAYEAAVEKTFGKFLDRLSDEQSRILKEMGIEESIRNRKKSTH